MASDRRDLPSMLMKVQLLSHLVGWGCKFANCTFAEERAPHSPPSVLGTALKSIW